MSDNSMNSLGSDISLYEKDFAPNRRWHPYYISVNVPNDLLIELGVPTTDPIEDAVSELLDIGASPSDTAKELALEMGYKPNIHGVLEDQTRVVITEDLIDIDLLEAVEPGVLGNLLRFTDLEFGNSESWTSNSPGRWPLGEHFKASTIQSIVRLALRQGAQIAAGNDYASTEHTSHLPPEFFHFSNKRRSNIHEGDER